MPDSSHAVRYLNSLRISLDSLDIAIIETLAESLVRIREAGGRLFVVGVGGSAANAGHAVADFRKLCGLESYSPSDSISEISARTNDDGWDNAYVGWLRVSRLSPRDGLLVLSVGGGSREFGLSVNLISAIDHAREAGAKVFAIVGRSDGYAAQHSDVCIVAAAQETRYLTPISESMQAVLWHLLATHPDLGIDLPVWEARVSP